MKTNVLLVFLAGIFVSFSTSAQIYTDGAKLAEDLVLGIFEEYILAPAAETDTFFMPGLLNIEVDVIIRAQDGLGFKPVMTGGPDVPSYLFSPRDNDLGAIIEFHGIRFVGESSSGAKYIGNGLFRVEAENIDLIFEDCEFLNFPGWNAVARYRRSGGNVSINNVYMENISGKIVQIDYRNENDAPNYVPLAGDIKVTNSTFINVYHRLLFELGVGNVRIDENNPDLKERMNAGATNYYFDHCTFYDISNVHVFAGRRTYQLAGDQAAVSENQTITNCVFAKFQEGRNINPDSASTNYFAYNYVDDGIGIAFFDHLNPITVLPVFKDTVDGARDLTLLNPGELIGSEGKPIGDPRWWGDYGVSVPEIRNDLNDIAKIFSRESFIVVETTTEVNQSTIMVFDLIGRNIINRAITSNRTEIMVPKGMYIIRLTTPEGILSRKVIINQ